MQKALLTIWYEQHRSLKAFPASQQAGAGQRGANAEPPTSPSCGQTTSALVSSREGSRSCTQAEGKSRSVPTVMEVQEERRECP